ncbi:hypothetical protein DL96DRAFT_1573730 [Flagelloscypha sp. PMI_526]|nr:hypothetical protein DL96DRAFT_1573730 [Flagelloscypha sp. PMI_526]
MADQTFTHFDLLNLPNKAALLQAFQNKSVDSVRTPALFINQSIFAKNCARMHSKAKDWGASFRAHVKTHKTAEGTKLQLESSSDKTTAIVCSTLAEAWGVVKAGLVSDGIVKDILYGLPIAKNKIEDFSSLWEEIEATTWAFKFLEEFEALRPTPRKWSAFIKIDGGQKRAGVPVGSLIFKELVTAAFASKFVDVYGFYCHAGNAYAATSLGEATNFLTSEVVAVNNGAKAALEILEANPSLKATQEGKFVLKEDIAQYVKATVVSFYAGRGVDGTDEAFKDTGPSGTYGEVFTEGQTEHGTLTRKTKEEHLQVGSKVDIVGQHACLVAAAYPWYYIVDSGVDGGNQIVDIWVPWKGW